MKKKLLSTVLVFTMAFAMTACGSKGNAGNKVTVTVDEVQNKMTEAIKEVDSAEISLDAAFGVALDSEGQKFDFDFDFNADGKLTVGTPAGYVKYSAEIKSSTGTDTQEEKMDGEAYAVTEGDKATLYYTEDNSWYTGEGSIEELISEFESSLSTYGMSMEDVLASATEENNTQKLTLSNKTVEAEGKECYELVVKMDKEMLNKELETVDEEILGGAEIATDMFDTFEGTIKMYVDVDTNLPVKVECDMDMVMSIDMYGSTMKMNMDDFSIEITADYNNVKAIEVPSDVKDNAINLAE